MYYLIRIILIIFVLTLLYLKPIYSLFILILFYFEFLYILDYLSSIYNNYNNYYVIDIKEINLSSMKVTDIWIEYCKLEAFKKIYLLFNKKKININNFIISLFILFLNIPFRFLKLSYYFIIKNKDDFRTGLEFLYFRSYSLTKNLKIEVLNKKIYLNCYTLAKLYRSIGINKQLSEQNIINGINAIKEQSNEFYKFESKDLLKINLISVNKNNSILFGAHYGHYENNNTIHVTSNIPEILEENQFKDVPIPDLTLKDAKNAGSIFTKGVENKDISIFSEYKIIKKNQLEGIMYNYPNDFKLNNETSKYISIKDEIYKNIIKEHFGMNINISKELISDLRVGNYLFILSNSYNYYLIEEYNKYINE